jgi:hypothetical protein
MDRALANSQASNGSSVALFGASTPHGSVWYNKTLGPVGWYWGNNTYNATTAR